jgi:hypothetical protein
MEYAVELVAAFAELTNARAKVEKQLKQLADGTLLIENFKESWLPVDQKVTYTYRVGNHVYEQESDDGPGNAANAMVRAMLTAAVKAEKDQAKANEAAVRKQGELLRADLKRLSPEALKRAKFAYLEQLAGRSIKLAGGPTSSGDSAPLTPKPDPPPPEKSPPKASAMKEPAAKPLDEAVAKKEQPKPPAPPHEQLVNGSFENAMEGWTQEGDAEDFRTYDERVGTYGKTKKEAAKGKIWQEFKIPPKATELCFEISGGRGRGIYVALLVDGKIIKSETARNANSPRRPIAWDIRDLRGKTVRLEVVDESTGPWQFITAGQFKVVSTE